MTLVLREGYDAMAAAAVDCGCRFFSGYPMLPFTGLLDTFARELPRTGGVLIQADTEIEGANMALGAAATGARAATGSTGQGIALMQETIAEAALNELPIVFFNVARGQQDYFQATRGGGWGDYRTIALAPASVVEAAELTTLAFELADRWLTPVLLYADHMIGFTQMTVEQRARERDAAAAGEAVGARRQQRRHRPLEGRVDLAPGQAQHARPRTEPSLAERRREVRPDRARSRPRHVGAPHRRRRGRGRLVRHHRRVRRLRGRRAARRRPPHRHVPAGHPLAVPERRARCGRRRATRASWCWCTSSTRDR